MFRQLSTVAFVVLVAVGGLAVVTAEEPKAASESKSPPKELTVDLGKGVKLEMVLIPAGEFLMGSPDSDKDAVPCEKPQHRVRITKPFYLGKYLVTQEQWEAVMDSNPSRFKGPKNPVETVGWDDCQELLDKLNKRQGNPAGKFVLPTEAQWEYACRAGSKTRYCFGDDGSKLGDYAWYDKNSGGKTQPVGEKKPNAWGLYDMHGNVWEGCLDRWKDEYYKESPVDDPMGAATGSRRVYRGGCLLFQPVGCRSAIRDYVEPWDIRSNLGLRVSLVLADKGSAAEPTPATPKQITNSIGSVLLYCPAGSFKMGSPADEKDRDSDREAQVMVTISKGFYLGKFSVTQSEFKAVIGASPWAGKKYVKEGDDYPATYIDWNDAAEFCRKLTARESQAGRLPQGYVYALPTEAQREYACRAGSTAAYSFGGDANVLGEHTWYSKNANDQEESYAHRVGQKKPNPWGFCDLHGNVREWCRDYYGEKLPGGTDPLLETTSDRVCRGGGWDGYAWRCRSASRQRNSASDRDDNLGFRIALVPSSVEAVK